ncbi:DUF2023 family protein [Aminithiophilus ramosus]|uniref:DUF2023 family protein n=2 Tax=Synergistales TaxID=649776 RepID=A0A9Q7EVU3_9BACT|nr:DUF2023 family protein [Aminithiophilus ramosus]NCB17953.1 DUF2023 family protein [Synergistales bacterium]QTX32244.1 DUF2023 family protein [Aminithiophilus ramosus]QVL36112.1 DUF2023 family protein [Synergistota bacterium]
MEVFNHHLYEYRKGVRQLILHTADAVSLGEMTEKLHRWEIPYVVFPLGPDRVNIFFGNALCVDVIRRIGKPSLTTYSDEEDFILGILLGYDKIQQCERYLLQRERRGDLVG